MNSTKNKTEPKRAIYILCRDFHENSGSYAGMFEEFAKYASLQGYIVFILSGRIDTNQRIFEKLSFAEVRRFPISVLRIPGLGMSLDYMLIALKIRRFLKQHPPSKEDIIVANGRVALGVIGRKYVLRMGQPAFTFLKNMEIGKKDVSSITRIARFVHFSIQSILERFCVRNASGFIFSSEESRMLTVHQYNKRGSYFIPHSGVNFHKEKNMKREPSKSAYILFVSAGTERVRKGVPQIERALPSIFIEYPDVKLLHIGEKFDWNVPEWCKKRILQVGRVPWNEMNKYYKNSLFMLSCALNEFIPNTIFECMSAGTPVLSSDIQGINELITHKKDGYVYPRGKEKFLAEGMRFLLEDRLKIKNMGRLAMMRVQSLERGNFNKRVLEFLEGVYSDSQKSSSCNLFKAQV